MHNDNNYDYGWLLVLWITSTRDDCCYLSEIIRNVVRNQGKWNGAEVAIKMLDRDTVVANTQIRLEIKAMRDIRHNNLTSFIGACCDSPNVCILMETAPKGSLDDILSMGSLQLDWNFKYSLLKANA